MKTMIQIIRGLREDNDLTQVQVAEFLGTSQTMYARYERGPTSFPCVTSWLCVSSTTSPLTASSVPVPTLAESRGEPGFDHHFPLAPLPWL